MKIKQVCLLSLLISASGSAWADVLPTLIDPNNPAKLASEVPQPAPAQKQTHETSVPSPGVATASSSLTMDTLIEVKHIQFIGGTRYKNSVLAKPFARFIGKKVPLKQLLAATQSITDRYHNDGFILSYAYLPSKNFQQGTLNVALVEGYIASTRIQSDNTNVARWLEKLSHRIMADKPLTKDLFERYSILMARTPDAKVTASANNPDNIYGATVMDVKAEHPHHWNLSSTVDIRKNQRQAVVNGTLSGLTPYGEQLGIATLVPLGHNDSRDKYVGLNYQQYLGNSGLQMQLRGSYYQTKPKDYTNLLTLPAYDANVDNKSKETQSTVGIQFNYPLLLTRQKQWSISGALDYLDKSYDYTFRATRGGQTLPIDIPSLNQKLRYPAAEFSLNGYREYAQAYWSTRFSLRQGIEGDVAHSDLPNSDLSFTRWRGNGEAAYIFAQKWRLSSGIEGDWSDNDLPEPERVSFGGLRYGRGYPDGEASGDYGYGGQVEMRYLHTRDSAWLNSIQPYVVVDTARTYFNSVSSNRKLASYATGLTFGDSKHYSVSLEGARPIADVPSDSDKRGWRFNATFTYNFN
ncbi:ShlB/FhaC/HecB family hemolysin secretion/activation protein [Budvicia diplopodorum]|uniref:ShlB/FhaC/HecB family hemolysin secretion/activation protein n=1 Tax=Budvicia diplopodorum TaxID=1119056 RepID=UPI001359EBEF|nr:POTRA domain-containing protein [Budvicia diplopodorum]